ncbi:MAG TPA: ABC transporter permease [Candidatus Binatia bacterium]
MTLLIAIPLLAIAWMLASNLSALLILNERRKLGLMRLRGVPGALLGQSLLLSIGAGGLIGGVIGLVLGTLLPLALYEHGALSWTVLGHVQGPLQMLLFLVVGLVFALWSSRKLVRYATTISPLEASRRVAPSESMEAAMRFGPLQLAALLIGLYKLVSWAADFDPARRFPLAEDDSASWIFFIKSLFMLDRALDFVALPLVVYGIVTLFVSRRSLMTALLAAVSRLLGGRLRRLSLRHMSFKPHRIASFLLIVALMASVSLYPSIGARSFEDKALRGATVEIGSELHIALGPGDLVPAEKLDQGLGAQAEALRAAVKERLGAVRDDNIVSIDTIVEALLPGFFFPGYGLSGVPLYLIDDPEHYLQTVFYDEKLGVGGNFSGIVRDLKTEKVAASPPVAQFWNLSAGDPILLGADMEKKPVLVPGGGVIGFLPGIPPRSIADRQSFVSARIDYLNYLSSNDAYLVATADNAKIGNLKVLVPRVLLLVRLKREQGADAAVQAIAGALKARPLEVRVLGRELKKIGGDMFIFLALENMRIYLVGGMLLALIAIAAIALTNYLEDRRTLGLLRVRGASPGLMFKFFASMLLAPALAGLIIGVVIAAAAGFGLTNLIWDLREIKSVVHLLPTHLVLSGATVWIGAGLFIVIGGIALLFSLWVFRRSARERMLE